MSDTTTTGATHFTHDEILLATGITRARQIFFGKEPGIYIPRHMPYRMIGVYLEAVVSGASLYNYYLSGRLNLIRDGASLSELPVFVGHDGVVAGGTDVCTKTLPNLFYNESELARWSVLLASRYTQSRVPIVPLSIVCPADLITWSIDDFKTNPGTFAGYRLWVGCLSSTDPLE